jgi:hypothetical protein
MADADRAWLEAALLLSRKAEQAFLGMVPQPLPAIVAIDARCTYLLEDGRVSAPVRSRTHGGSATLPNGSEVGVGPISFASHESGGFFAMSLPSVWRAAGVASELGLERLMDGVLLHELLHVRQSALANAALARPAQASGIADDLLDDDIIQRHFGTDPAYAIAWAAERDLLFAAAAAPDDDVARELAIQALKRMRSRRARWFSGTNAPFAELDDIFLSLEGMGQWLAYRALLSPEGGQLSAEQALPAIRRGGRQWSQDQGLALLLTVDRLLPGWQQRAFRDPDWRAERLLAAAVERRRPTVSERK